MNLRRRRNVAIVVLILFAMLFIAGFALSSKQFAGAVVATPTLAGNVCNDSTSSITVSVSEGMSADFPCQPNRVVEQVSTIIGNLDVVHYIADAGSSRYDIMYTDYSPMFTSDLNGLLRQIALNKAKSESMDEYLVKEVSSEPVSLAGFPGELINGTNSTLAVRMQLYLVGKKLYRVTVRTPLAEIDNAVYAAFLKSFQITASR